ncbi:hypothetical protein LTR16_002903 [Cryomyces antarcticus]|uniref:Uncharacterized protein n=1 Tax=Cryomyces antarcticus TaxID=329879 RepID=A0ABR0KSX1_9PEZI|nr:hypothetical protein LTR39_002099 [Cryomyces antarcticus]KAK5017227.1 hypothetical protein LTR60_002029 [Cryomyces antarcticus]KAK5127255.1 hypothetical protein LTR16_002903 [Cryomyces antarcticus]
MYAWINTVFDEAQATELRPQPNSHGARQPSTDRPSTVASFRTARTACTTSGDSGKTLSGPARHDPLAAGPEAFFKQTSRASPNASESSDLNLPSERDFAHPENNNRPPTPQHEKRYRIRWIADFRRRHAAGHAGRKLAKAPSGDVVAANPDLSRESIPEDAPRPTDHVFAHLKHGEEPAAEGQAPASRSVRRWLEDYFLQW